jgi:hypothetical protein
MECRGAAAAAGVYTISYGITSSRRISRRNRIMYTGISNSAAVSSLFLREPPRE